MRLPAIRHYCPTLEAEFLGIMIERSREIDPGDWETDEGVIEAGQWPKHCP